MENRITAFLKQGNVCVIATSFGDLPQATPIEYYSDGLTVYVAASRGAKLRNLEANRRISLAIYNKPWTDWMDWDRVKGLQMNATAELLRFGEQPEAYLAALEIYDWRKYRRAMGKMDEAPRNTTIVKILPATIHYRDLGLLREGYAVVQQWKASEADA